ncbi:MAG TPA: glycosyltransferase family 1 protein [Gemmatimonadales bacterium]|nr:glycosyltransferase family 1 protein [Gemmatimonadales bacterium]
MVSGVGVTLLRLTEALQARGHEVRVYTASYDLPEGSADRPEVHRSPSLPFFLYRDVQWAFPRGRDLLNDAQAFRPDVVHVATEYAMGLAGLKVARKLDVPVVASAHTDYEKYASRYGMEWAVRAGWPYLRWFYDHAARVLCPSKLYEQHLHSRGVFHTGIWSRGINPAEFHPRFRSEAYRRAMGVGPTDALVTYIGRIAKEKNLDLLLEAWELLGMRREGAQLVLVGHGPLKEAIRQRNIPGVRVAGLKQGRELSEAYASADLFVFPSSTETFGNVLLEAMGSGLPSVVTAAGGVLEFAVHGRNAWLVAPDSSEAMLAGLDRLLHDSALRRQLSEGAIETARARSWDGIYEGLVDEYRWAMAQLHANAA